MRWAGYNQFDAQVNRHMFNLDVQKQWLKK